MDDNQRLAQLLFGDIDKTPEDYKKIYPVRNLKEGARVTRFAPSPTGFLHIGGLFAAMISKINASQTHGVFILRIEDTDKKREIENGVEEIINGLDAFGITPDEGVIGVGGESGSYGPYQQSLRKDIYQCFAKYLVEQGLAYPCFCGEDELNSLREKQESVGADKGYYGEYAKCRKLSFDEQKANIEAGKPYVLRLRSPGSTDKKICLDDLIKGKIEMPENIMDIVLLKTDGIPTYHFAHAVDDSLMGTTHVIRGDEWISSAALHIQLFRACGFKAPKYAHIAPIMKEENGGKRKLSKRKDPEAAVSFYIEQGYPKESVIEYLLTLANSNFEDWRKANKTAKQSEFPFNLKKMSVSGALFDLVKLSDVSKNVISLMSADEVYSKAVEWARAYDEQLYTLFSENENYAKAILSIDRDTPKPRKDISKWNEIRDYTEYFYSELYKPCYDLPENISKAQAVQILESYLQEYDYCEDKDLWFSRIKNMCTPLGYTPDVREYKKNPDAYKGHVGDVSSVIRIAVTSRKNTPDLHAIMQLLGENEVIKRLNDALAFFKG